MLKKYTFALLFFAACSAIALGHNPGADRGPLPEWHLKKHGHIHASFLMMRGENVMLETGNGDVKSFPITDFSAKDQQFFREKKAEIERLNQQTAAAIPPQPVVKQPVTKSGNLIWFFALLAGFSLFSLLFLKPRKKTALAFASVGSIFLFAFNTRISEKLLGTDPHFIDSAFQPFKPQVATHWNNTWFFVESNGIPTTHPMMAGITKWQQQVPTPQCYIGSNAWQIPLNPVLAAQPVPVSPQHFLRGAVAIAANGIPIFNPYTNTGVDALVDGQLDQWGGHCGRADDYHYHIAPLHLDPQTPDILPIAFALDGFAVYAGLEPDGSPMLPLDANHGHFYAAGVYHYHGTPEAPYMIGNMVGKVTEDSTLQIIPQAKASPVRPFLQPLSGATITGCQPNTAGNGYTLTYTRNGQTYQVEYSWTNAGVYTFNFISPTGTTTEVHNGHLPCTVPVSALDLLDETVAIQVWPNPSIGDFSLKINGLDEMKLRRVSVFDLSGKMIYQKEQPGLNLSLDKPARGIYWVKMDFDKGQATRKIVIQ